MPREIVEPFEDFTLKVDYPAPFARLMFPEWGTLVGYSEICQVGDSEAGHFRDLFTGEAPVPDDCYRCGRWLCFGSHVKLY